MQSVLPDSPAENGGLKRGDLVVLASDQTVSDPQTLLKKVDQAEIGAPLPLKVVRGDKEVALTVTPEALPGFG